MYPDIIDPTLGNLHYEDRLGWYETAVTHCGTRVRVCLSTDESGDVTRPLEFARRIIGQIVRYSDIAKDYAASQLLNLKNEAWLDDDEDPLTLNQFKDRVRLESIVCYSSEGATFYHEDGDLFCGHCIELRMNSNHEFTEACIAG